MKKLICVALATLPLSCQARAAAKNSPQIPAKEGAVRKSLKSRSSSKTSWVKENKGGIAMGILAVGEVVCLCLIWQNGKRINDLAARKRNKLLRARWLTRSESFEEGRVHRLALNCPSSSRNPEEDVMQLSHDGNTFGFWEPPLFNERRPALEPSENFYQQQFPCPDRQFSASTDAYPRAYRNINELGGTPLTHSELLDAPGERVGLEEEEQFSASTNTYTWTVRIKALGFDN